MLVAWRCKQYPWLSHIFPDVLHEMTVWPQGVEVGWSGVCFVAVRRGAKSSNRVLDLRCSCLGT
jgi:hypothetical protein